MNRILPIFALLFVSACDRQEPSVAPATNAVAEAPSLPAVKAPVPALKGEWRVVTVSGNPATMALSVGDGRATMSAGCLRRGFTYTQDRNRVAFAAAPAGSSNCGRSPRGDEEAAFAALGESNMAIFGKDGRDLTLSGFGGTLTLERR